MDKPLTLFRRLTRNVRWYFEDVVTGVTGKGTLHFVYGDRHQDVNPATGAPMLSSTRDVHGYRWGTIDKD
jgi:hypothetical protein